jgi:membrane associated rhomboid family serine protease
LFAFGYLHPNVVIYFNLLFPIKAKYFVAIYAALELFYGVANRPGDNVAHFAHLGGMLFAFILLRFWRRNRHNTYY